jgi:hypothetical protein
VEGLSLTRRIGYPYAEARLLAVSGLLASRTQVPEQAHAYLEAAVTLFRRLGAHRDSEQTACCLAALRLS